MRPLHPLRRAAGHALVVLLGALPMACTASAEQVGAGEAQIRYLRNSGWLVETQRHVLVFDYIGGDPSAADSTLDHGYLTASDLAGKQAVVFVTHGHRDHFDEGVLDWAEADTTIRYVFGWPGAPGAGRDALAARARARVGTLDLLTIASTDQGVGFLVEVDGLVLFHAGDHARWTDAMAGAFLSEIEFLRPYAGEIDVAFVPIATGAFGGCEPRHTIYEGIVEAARILRPALLVPMHVDCPARLSLYRAFADRFGADVPGVPVHAVEGFGESFSYRAAGD